jgi:hypothetical protein
VCAIRHFFSAPQDKVQSYIDITMMMMITENFYRKNHLTQKSWSSRLGVERGAKKHPCEKNVCS